MNAVVLLVVGVAILVAGYIFYGGWLAKQWGLGENKRLLLTQWRMVRIMFRLRLLSLWDITFHLSLVQDL